MDFEVTVETPKDVPTVLRDLERALTERQFSTLWHLSVNDKLKEKGFTLEPEFHILEVCNAARAKQALETNIKVGYFLPCKVVVYRQGDKTAIGLPRPEMLMDLLGDERLRDLAREVESTLREAVEAAARA